MNMNRNNILYRKWAAFLTWFGDIMLRTSPPKVEAIHIRKLEEMVEPGDVICREYDCYLDSFFISGEYTHSGFVTCRNTIAHAVAEGVEVIDIIDFVKNADGFILLRYGNATPEFLRKTFNFVNKNEGKPYDFFFDKKEMDHFYCHEFTYRTLQAGGAPFSPEGDVIYADFFINNLDVIYRAGK